MNSQIKQANEDINQKYPDLFGTSNWWDD